MSPTQRLPSYSPKGTMKTDLSDRPISTLHTHTVTLRGLLTFMRVLKEFYCFSQEDGLIYEIAIHSFG